MKLTDALLESHSQLRKISDELLASDNIRHQSLYFEQLWQQFLVHEHGEEFIAFHIMKEKVDKNEQVNNIELTQKLNFAKG